MSYKKHRYGSTNIKNKRIDNLSIGWDANVRDPETCSKSKRFPVFLFTPDMDNTNTHYHISLNRKEVRQLKQWLTDFLKDTDTTKPKKRHRHKPVPCGMDTVCDECGVWL